jgi:hypothetical protein
MMMLRKAILHRIVPLIMVAGLLQPAFHGSARAQDPLSQRLETKKTVLLYRSMEDLARFESKVRYGGGFGSFFSQRPKGDDLLDAVAEKVDKLYERVQEILDMRGEMAKVTLRLYPDQDALARAYRAFTGSGNLRVRAWYIYERNTIYLNVRDVNEGIVAHEMAHAIIDHYLLVRPPRATAEILARYVDEHLKY